MTSAAISAQRLHPGRQEVRLQQQVLRRVAVDRQLREDDELGAGLPCARYLVADLGGVAVDVADGGIDLGERDAQRLCLTVHALILRSAGF